MFGRSMYLSMFNCLCFVKEIYTDISEEQVQEERYPDLNKEEGIIMEDSREEHWVDVSEEGDDKNNIHSLR